MELELAMVSRFLDEKRTPLRVLSHSAYLRTNSEKIFRNSGLPKTPLVR